MKKIIFCFLMLIMALSFAISPAYADCSDCDASNCEECGCVLSKDKMSCAYSNYESGSVTCGGNFLTKIPKIVPKITSLIYKIIQISVPVVLVIIGSIDFIKCIVAQKEDEIKKGQQLFIKRLLSAGLIFSAFIIVKAFVSFIATERSNIIIDCAQCFLENECDSISSGLKEMIDSVVQ